MKVGVFDSGLGGLTVVDSILKLLNGIELFYIADTKFAPYGEKSKEQILKHSISITDYLIKNHNIDALVIACNSATSAAIVELRQKYKNLIVIGTEPGLKPAINATKTNKIGVLATKATLTGNKYQELYKTLSSNNQIEVLEEPCIGLVKQIENGLIEHDDTYKMMEKWLRPMKEKNVDTIVLGCTHYPLLKNLIKEILGDEVILIETGNAIASRLEDLAVKQGLGFVKNNSLDLYYTGIINTNMVDSIISNYTKCEKIEIRENYEWEYGRKKSISVKI